jgi:GNAT superfamily N-acetyltransferase
MEIRFAREDELEKVNVLRKQVNDLHVEGKPDVFKPGFGKELQDFVHVIWEDPEQEIVVADDNGQLCGFAVLHHIYKPENPFMKVRDFLDIDEFCVDKEHRRQGVATQLVDFIKEYAKEKGFHRLELNMWEFNQDALAFYESAGFETFRRYMEMEIN